MKSKATIFTQAMIEDILERLSLGETALSVAEDYGLTKSAFYAAMARSGVNWHKVSRLRPFPTLRRRVEEMHPLDAVSVLLDLVELLTGFQEVEVLGPRAEGFKPQEARVLLHLLVNRGIVVPREKLLIIASPNGSDADPSSSSNLIDVLVSSIRRKSRALGYELTIENERGVGFVARVGEGFIFPWEAGQ